MLSGLLGIARVVPVWAWALVALLAWGGIQRHRASSAAGELRQAQAAAAIEREQALQASITETQRRLAAQQEIAHAADEAASRARADAHAAAGAAGRLRQRIAALQAGAGAGNPATAGASSADRLGEALATCADRYREVAAAADRAVAAGLACERAYQSLTD
jgi:hypothetical protein